VKKLVIACLAALAVALPAGACAQPVPSLTPAATHRLWLAEVARAKRHPRAVSDASCRPARILMYAQTDWAARKVTAGWCGGASTPCRGRNYIVRATIRSASTA
jgi:hypothetical protein